jgi:hypothetical protein
MQATFTFNAAAALLAVRERRPQRSWPLLGRGRAAPTLTVESKVKRGVREMRKLPRIPSQT